MLNNPKFQTFLNSYYAIADETEAALALKNFMLSLPIDELMAFMGETSKAHNEAVKQRLAGPNCSEIEKQAYKKQFDMLLSAFSRQIEFQKAA